MRMRIRKIVYFVLIISTINLFFLEQMGVAFTSSGSDVVVKSDDSTDRNYWPTEEWILSTPNAQGMNQSRLEEMVEFILDNNYALESVVIIRNGYIAFQESDFGRLKDLNQKRILYSVTKSITSALIGIAIDKGYINSTTQKVIDFFPNKTIANLDSRKRNMTIEHLLTMSPGMEWEGPDDMTHTWGQAVLSGDPIQFILDQPMHYEPGTVWYYNGGCSHLLSAILTEATGNSTLSFAQEHLFNPLGITDVYWPIDPQGYYYGGQDIWLSPYNMAKIGYLFLNNGSWDGNEIVSKEWVLRSQETVFSGLYDFNYGYGYQWWTMDSLGGYFAWGNYEQKIVIFPTYDLVVVFTASLESYLIEQWLLEYYILPALVDGSPTKRINGFSVSVLILTLFLHYLFIRKRR